MGYRIDDNDQVVGVVHFTDPHLADALTSVKTQFVRDRIRETPWHARAYIGDLLHVEDILASDGPHGWAGHVVWHRMRASYPVEIEAIRQELTAGVLTSSEEFHQQSQAHEEAESQRQRTAVQRAAAQEALDLRYARKAWERAGGAVD